MRRGEVRRVDFDPTRGSEAAKVRPAVVVSNDAANGAAERLGRGVVVVVPLTSDVQSVRPFQVRIDAGVGGLRQHSKAQCEQVRAVSVDMIGDRIGRLPPETMRQVDAALRLHLDL